MRLERDDRVTLPGHERQTLQCTGCNETAQRTVFVAEPASGPAEPAPATIAPSPAATLATSIVFEADRELDEGEALLRRAIEMVRGSIRITTARKAGANRSSPTRARRPPSRIVQIRHDPSEEPPYAAADTTSGLVLLRHRDSAHLRSMCDRLGWEVAEERVPGTGK